MLCKITLPQGIKKKKNHKQKQIYKKGKKT